MSVKEGTFRPSDLLAQFKQIGSGTRAHVRAAELLDNTVEVIREMVYAHTMAQPKHTGTNVYTRFSLSTVELLPRTPYDNITYLYCICKRVYIHLSVWVAFSLSM